MRDFSTNYIYSKQLVVSQRKEQLSVHFKHQHFPISFLFTKSTQSKSSRNDELFVFSYNNEKCVFCFAIRSTIHKESTVKNVKIISIDLMEGTTLMLMLAKVFCYILLNDLRNHYPADNRYQNQLRSSRIVISTVINANADQQLSTCTAFVLERQISSQIGCSSTKITVNLICADAINLANQELI